MHHHVQLNLITINESGCDIKSVFVECIVKKNIKSDINKCIIKFY